MLMPTSKIYEKKKQHIVYKKEKFITPTTLVIN